MFGINKNIKTANETIRTLTAQVESANKEIESLKQQLSESPTKIKELETSIEAIKAEHSTKIESLVKEHEAKVKELEQAAQVTKAKVGKEAAIMLKQFGVSEDDAHVPSEQAGTNAKSDYTSIMAKLNALPRGSKERAKFYNDNKAVITQPLYAVYTTQNPE